MSSIIRIPKPVGFINQAVASDDHSWFGATRNTHIEVDDKGNMTAVATNGRVLSAISGIKQDSEGCFPSWRQVFPKKEAPTVIRLDIKHLKTLVDAACAVASESHPDYEAVETFLHVFGETEALMLVTKNRDAGLDYTGILVPLSKNPDITPEDTVVASHSQQDLPAEHV